MLLTVDIGNTQTVLGFFEDDELHYPWRIATIPSRTADECWAQVLNCCQAQEIDPKIISGIAISSVAPVVTASFKRMAQDWLNIAEPFILQPEKYRGIRIKYNPPRAVGADRICNAVAGFQAYGGPLIIVDFGTATTFDVVDENGDYLGGTIMPGLETGAAELFKRAARLYKVDFTFPPSVIGSSTEESLQAGILFSAVDGVDGIVKRIKKELRKQCKVIATGGLASLIAKNSNTIEKIEPFLVLRGLNIIYRQERE